MYYYAPPHRAEALSDDVRLTSVCLTSVAYIRPKSRTERPRKTKIGTEVGHVTRESDTTFKVKRSTWCILRRPPTQLVSWCSCCMWQEIEELVSRAQQVQQQMWSPDDDVTVVDEGPVEIRQLLKPYVSLFYYCCMIIYDIDIHNYGMNELWAYIMLVLLVCNISKSAAEHPLCNTVSLSMSISLLLHQT